uniref:actin cross-linking domain-containing toxin n=1 Tax=Streptomyces caniscabiei TaxID=2746961 RepID=UPI00117F61A6
PAAAPPAHLPGAPGATRAPRAVAPPFDTSFPAPSIGTESELGGFVVALPDSADRTFAFVSKADTDEPLLMVTKDMSKGAYTNPADLSMAQRGNWQTHTVELITYPSRLGDQGAIGARDGATQWLLDVFKERLGIHNHRPLESMVSPDGLYRLQVTSDRHVIAAGTGLELEGIPSVSMPTTQQQATIGIRAVDFGSRATPELRLLADHAHWYKPAFRDDDALRTALTRETLDAPEQVENAYTYVKSVIDFTSDLVRRHGIPMEDWAGAPPYLGLTHPAVKNEWSVLPRTRPSLVLDSLSPGDRAVTLRLLREAPALGPEPVWKAARQYILNGNEVAGRGINNATVGGERALLFEFRSLPDELKGAVPHEKAPVAVVTDPLAELGGNRAVGVQRINDFVSGPENRDAFADWYRTEFPRDPDAGRIHQNKSTDAILKMAAARHKAEWINLRHPQAWQDITTRPVAPVRPPVSAVPSVPPVPPRADGVPLPGGSNRPLTNLDEPHIPAADVPRPAQPTGVDLPRITRTPDVDLPLTTRTPDVDLPLTTRTPDVDLPLTTQTPDVGLQRIAQAPEPDLPRITEGPDVTLLRTTPAQDVTFHPTAAPELSGSPLRGQSLDSPLSPAPSVREVPLSGLDDVAGLRLRVTEVPATDAAPASVRVEVLDLTAQGGPARLPDASVTVREGGGFTATGPQGGARWQFDAAGRLEHRELPLTGTDFSLRFTDDALRPIQVTGPDGVPVPGATVRPVRDASGTPSELTVRVPMPGPDGPTAVWRFEPGGLTHSRELPLTLPGPDGPSGLGLRTTTAPGAGGTTTRVLELTGPPDLTASFRLDPVGGTLAGRLPHGFTVTDTSTGARFHFDADGRLALRDGPAQDGSAFLRITEGAGPDTPPVRLDELGDLGELGALDDVGALGDTLGERFPLGSLPEHETLDDALGTAELARVFERTLDEASGLRTVPEGDPVDLSGIAGAVDFLHTAPDGHAFQALDLPGVQRLADDAAASLDRLGLRPDLLGEHLRELTERARLGLRRGAVGALDEYLDLPLATRLEDLRAATPTGRVLGDFTVTPTPHGGPGGSRYTVRHNPSDLSLGFDANRSLVHQEVFLRGGPAELDGLKVGITGRSVDGGPWTPTAADFAGARPADDLFTLSPGTEPRGGLVLTDAAGTTRWHYGPEGVHAFRDVDLPGDRGVLRFEAGGAPRVLDVSGNPRPGFRAEALDHGKVALVPTAKGTQPLERAVLDPAGTLLEETVAVRVKGGKVNGQLWRIDHAGGTAVRLDDTGTPLTGRFDTAKLEKSATGQYKLIGEGKVTLFEREVLGNGHVLHLDLDRFGRARWTEFDEAGNRLRAGERIFDGDRRTYHDTLPYRWAPVDVLDVRTYTKALDGGLIRAEKNTEGGWAWTRFDKDGTEVLHGTRDWSWTRIGYKDTYLDPATGERAVAQRRGDVWPLNGYHGSRQYLEHPLLSGPAPGGMRTNPVLHTAVGPNNKPIDFIDELTEEMAQLADGGTLHVARISDQRLPAAVWYPRAGHGRFDGFFRNLVTGDSMFQVSTWTETAADGAKLRGVRLVAHAGRGWQDIDQFGRIVRETRTLENGNVVEVGRSAADPKQWAPAPKWNGSADAYELPWLDTKSGRTGTRYVAADGGFVDVFKNAAGDELLSLRSQGTGVREYLAENPARGIGADDVSGVWVDKNTQLQITGRRDHWGELFVEAHGDPRKDHWTWTATGPDGQVTEGVRIQNRGSLVHTRTWDDSFTDFERLPGGRRGDAIRERNATGDGSLWVDATRDPDGTWTWRKIGADGTIESRGIRTYQDLAGGRWTDHIGTDAVRFRNGGRVREYAYTVNERVAPPPVESGRISLSDLLSRSARHFETDVSATVNREVWQEFDMGKVVRRRDPVEGFEGRFRESESLWNQWREYQDGRLVAQRTITGRVWVTDAFGRWSNFDIAKLPEISSLPRVGGEVGLDGHRSWRLVGREVDFRGYTTELRGYNREFRDVFHEIWTGVEDGSSAAMPMWRHQLRKAVTDFTMGYLIEFGTSFAVSAIVADLDNKKFELTTALQRAALNGAIGGGIRVGVNVAYDTTRLGYLKYGLANLDQGQDWHRHPLASNDDWDGEWTVFENPVRWRSGTYDFFNNLGVGVLTGFVNGAVNAAVFGVDGHKRTGVDALEAGAWGAAASAFAGVTSGLLRYGVHATAGSRLFHRGGPGELIWQIAEALGAGTLNYGLNNKNADIQPSRAFPP